jgi:two-component system nitrogen regulation response regulator GlnG
MARILVVDDERDVRDLLGDILTDAGHEVLGAADGAAALEQVRTGAPAVVFLDLNLPGRDGLAVLSEIKTVNPEVPVIILTANSGVQTAVEAMRRGAYDYLTKPFVNDDLVLTVRRALEREHLRTEVQELKAQVGEAGSLVKQMGTSAHIRKVIQQVNQVAGSTFTVLIQGETGTGKELVARAIHQHSARKDGPFIALDCGAIPETLIESELFGYEKGAFTGADRRKDGHFHLAEGGTLFLDEVVNLPLTTQAKLLRALQERQVWTLGAKAPTRVDVRIIAACNVSLEAEARAGRFRLDLYYRLNEFTIELPPLRQRSEDVVPLARRFLDEAAMELKRPVRGFSPAAESFLVGQSWPGNVRELRNVVRRSALLAAELVEAEHLALPGASPPASPAPLDPGAPSLTLREARDRAVAEAERQAIIGALARTHGNKSEAARALKTDYKTLHIKVKQYGLGRTREYTT